MRSNTLAEYVGEAARLRHAMTLNELDFDFSKAGGTIHYILDSNVVQMFVNPNRNTNLLGPFASWLDPETSVATATVTAEFLLSKALPGHNPDEPSVMAPDHFEEVISLARRAAIEIDNLSDQAIEQAQAELDQERTAIRELTARLDERELNHAKKVELLRKELPGLLQNLVDGPLSEVLQLRRVLKNANLGRIDGQRWYTLTELPSGADEDDWHRRIIRASHLPRGTHPSGRDRSYNLIADARSLALVSDIIDDYKDSDKDRFLFVTADVDLLRATESFIAELVQTEDKNAGANVFVRHPREFLPLINLSTINKDQAFRRVFDQIGRALDSLLTGIPAVTLKDEGYRFREPTLKQIRSSLAIKGSSDESVAELKAVWTAASREALASSLSLLEDREADLFRDLSQLVNSADIKKDIRTRILASLSRLIEDHSGLTIQGVFEAIERRLVYLRTRGLHREDAVLRVTPYFIDNAIFSDLLPGGNLELILRSAARGEDQSALHEHLARKGPSSTVYLLLACLCLAVGLWDAAKDFASKSMAEAKRLRRRPSHYHDIVFIYATALRLGMRSKQDYSKANEILTKDIRALSQEKKQLLLRRARSEQAALMIGFVEQQLIASRGPMSPESYSRIRLSDRDRTSILSTAADHLNSVWFSLENDVGGDQWSEKLMVQVAVNSAAYWIVISFLEKSIQLERKLDVNEKKILDELDRILATGRGVSPVTKPYRLMLGAIQPDAPPDQIGEAIDLLRKLAEDDTLPRTDTEVMTFFADELVARKLAV